MSTRRLAGVSCRILVAVAVLLPQVAGSQSYDTPGFYLLGTIDTGGPIFGPYGISADGSTIYGRTWDSAAKQMHMPLHWTEESAVAITPLPPGALSGASRAVSADGSKIALWFGDADPEGNETWRQMYLWQEGWGVFPLGDLPGGALHSYPNAMSADGNVIVGWGQADTNHREAIRWTPTTGVQSLGVNPTVHSVAWGVSADGTIIVGTANHPNGDLEAFRWTEAGGAEFLGDLPGGELRSVPYIISADGSVIGGYGVTATGWESMLWWPDGQMIPLGNLPDSTLDYTTVDELSADGSIALGYDVVQITPTLAKPRAFVWDMAHGMRTVRELFENEYGWDMSEWITLGKALGLSGDGRRMIGYATRGNGYEGWMAVLPPACSDGLDNDGDGLADHPDDPGCSDADDASERSASLPCDDGLDDDGDGRKDFDPFTRADGPGFALGRGDPGCHDPGWPTESPDCQNGVNDDGATGTDFDGGASLLGGVPADVPDPECVGKPWRNKEGNGCGLGYELAPLLVLLGAGRRRLRRGRANRAVSGASSTFSG